MARSAMICMLLKLTKFSMLLRMMSTAGAATAIHFKPLSTVDLSPDPRPIVSRLLTKTEASVATNPKKIVAILSLGFHNLYSLMVLL